MATYISPEQLQKLKQAVFDATSKGNAEEISNSLAGLCPELIQEILQHHSPGSLLSFGHSLRTPLSVAAALGHTQTVRLLLEEYGVDIDKSALRSGSGSVRHPVLSLAALEGHLQVAKCLVQNGADINRADIYGNTALRQACKGRHEPVIEYLLEQGAETEHADVYRRTCLFESCWNGHEEAVSLLLQHGANPNQQSVLKTTPLLVAIRLDNVGIVQLLLSHGARVSSGGSNYTILIEAALLKSVESFELLLTLPEFSRQEKIDGLEILGSRSEDHTRVYHYFHRATVERYRNPADILLKPQRPPEPFLGNIAESQTMEELESRKNDLEILQIERLLVLERILGPEDINVGNAYLTLVLHLHRDARFREAIAVWLHASKSSLLGCEYVLINSCQNFILRGSASMFSHIREVLQMAIQDMEGQALLKQEQKDTRWNGRSYVLACIFLVWGGLQDVRSADNLNELQDLVRRLITVAPLLPKSSFVLQIAFEGIEAKVCQDMMPQPSVSLEGLVNFLIRSGADVNAKDGVGNSPLHSIVRWDSDNEDCAESVCTLTRILLEAGAHVDARNDSRMLPADMATSEEVKSVFQEYSTLSLKCLAASVIKQYGVPFQDQVPDFVAKFIELH